MTMNGIYFLAALLYMALSSAVAQTSMTSGASCCSIYMMDSTGQVLIETQRPLTPNVYRAVRVRACTTGPFAVQIWRRVDNTHFQFRFQIQITPVLSTTTVTYVVMNFDMTPITVTADDRIGLFSPMSSMKLSVPFSTDPTNAYLYNSITRFSDFTNFTGTLLPVAMDDLRWDRTFNASVTFCTAAGCTDQQNPAGPVATVAPSTTPGFPAGSPGPVGPPGTCNCAAQPGGGCDTTGTVGSITNLTSLIISLQNTIIDIQNSITQFFGNQPTGTCLFGFTPGSYGVGKCYMLYRQAVQFGVAVLSCRDNYKAQLISIDNALEEAFLKTFITNSALASVENYWTSGMYDPPTKRWYWDDLTRGLMASQTYTNWGGTGTPPTPPSDSFVCSTLTIDTNRKLDYWQMSNCLNQNFYICEIPKMCK